MIMRYPPHMTYSFQATSQQQQTLQQGWLGRGVLQTM